MEGAELTPPPISQISSDVRFAIQMTNRNRNQIARSGALRAIGARPRPFAIHCAQIRQPRAAHEARVESITLCHFARHTQVGSLSLGKGGVFPSRVTSRFRPSPHPVLLVRSSVFSSGRGFSRFGVGFFFPLSSWETDQQQKQH